MNIRTLISTALIGLPMLAFARPATPELLTQTNPDGSTIQYRLHGNEQFNFRTDASGTTILEFNNKGFLAPAVRNGRVMTTSATDINLLRAEKLPVQQPVNNAVSRMAALVNGRSTYPTIGDIPALVILIEYADTPFSTANPQETFDKLCNEEGYSDYGSQGSARDYYIDASNGLFRPHFDVYGPVKVSHDAAFYTGRDAGNIDAGTTAYFGYAIEEAVKALDGEIDYSKYDLDSNGIIDNIFFFYSGRGQADTGNKNYIWPHQGDFWRYTPVMSNSIGLDRLFVDGVEVRTYACSNELNSSLKIPANLQPYVDGIGAFVHEYGHVLGLPDLYDTSNMANNPIGKFDVMDKGSYNELSTLPPMFSAYEKWVCHWLEYTEAEDGTTYNIPSISTGTNAKAVRAHVKAPGRPQTGEYFIFESRTAEGWDRSLEQDGMLIWRINYDKTAWENNQVNVRGMNNVEIIRPDIENRDIVVWPGDEGKYTYLTPETPDFKLTAYHYPNGNKYWISNISYDPESKTATFDYNLYTSISEESTLLHDNPTADVAAHNVHLEWDPVPGATDYMLTVQMKNSFGRFVTFSNYDNLSTNGATKATVASIPVAYWDNEFTAQVLPVVVYPSKNASNVVSFVPSSLPEISAVEVIEADMAGIYGLHGRIEAPAGARIFNLSGVETGKDNLPAGVYIVVLNGKTAKVIVK